MMQHVWTTERRHGKIDPTKRFGIYGRELLVLSIEVGDDAADALRRGEIECVMARHNAQSKGPVLTRDT